MFDYTKTIFKKTVDDLDFALAVFRFVTQTVYISYLVYLLLSHSAIWYLHLTLLIISAAFFVFDIITSHGLKNIRQIEGTPLSNREKRSKIYEANRKRSLIRRVKFCIAHVLKIFVLAISLYPIVASPDTVHPLSIICTTVMVLMWIMQIVFEILRMIFENRGQLFVEAISADIEVFKKPVDAVKNTFRRFMGREVEESPEPTRARKYLDELVAAERADKSESKDGKKKKLSEWLESRFSKAGHESADADEEMTEESEVLEATSERDND